VMGFWMKLGRFRLKPGREEVFGLSQKRAGMGLSLDGLASGLALGETSPWLVAN